MDTKERIAALETLLADANKTYRLGEAAISDFEYDALQDELRSLDPDNALLSKVGLSVEDMSDTGQTKVTLRDPWVLCAKSRQEKTSPPGWTS